MLANQKFSTGLGLKAWSKMLATINIAKISTIGELGSNIGRNIEVLRMLLPWAKFSAYDINLDALTLLRNKFPDVSTFSGSILDLNTDMKMDLVFTSQVLIHVSPENLESAMHKLFSMANRYILIAEYFNRTPTSIPYRGETDVLFKSDFGGKFMDLFDAKCLDYGFLWGREYDEAGFDDVTYWLFERR